MVSVIIPTLNERGSLPTLFEEWKEPAKKLLTKNIRVELLIIDDNSSDGTAEYVESTVAEMPFALRLIKRSERGLATAVLRGITEANGDWLIIMDADGSHPPALIPKMVHALANDVDIVLPSRYMPGGGSEDWTWNRKFISRIATGLARIVGIKASDPMSGFFGLQRKVIDTVHLSPIGYKILLEILVKGRYRTSQEIAYTFRNRVRGQSKMSRKIIVQYLRHLWKLWWWKHTKKEA